MSAPIKEYRVVWSIDVWAQSPLLAALCAEELQRGQTAEAGGHFVVIDTRTGKEAQVDLADQPMEPLARHRIALGVLGETQSDYTAVLTERLADAAIEAAQGSLDSEVTEIGSILADLAEAMAENALFMSQARALADQWAEHKELTFESSENQEV